jgi:hypothetical protein
MNDQMFQLLKLLPQCAAYGRGGGKLTEGKICMHLPLMTICITERQD